MPADLLHRANLAISLCRPLRVVAACAFAYEAAAITTRRIPTISTFTARHRWLIPIPVCVLAAHLAVHPAHKEHP